jgi:hypothetical protein
LKRINKESDLFEWLLDNVYSDLLICRNPVSRWDCYSPKRKHRIELKCRKKHYPDLLVEKAKYDAILSECTKHDDIPVYINSTPEGIYAFDMREHNGIWEFKNMPKTTEFSSRHFVPKEVGYFYIDQGHTLLNFS